MQISIQLDCSVEIQNATAQAISDLSSSSETQGIINSTAANEIDSCDCSCHRPESELSKVVDDAALPSTNVAGPGLPDTSPSSTTKPDNVAQSFADVADTSLSSTKPDTASQTSAGVADAPFSSMTAGNAGGMPTGLSTGQYAQAMDFAELLSQLINLLSGGAAESGQGSSGGLPPSSVGGLGDIGAQDPSAPNYREISLGGSERDTGLSGCKIFQNADTGDCVAAFCNAESSSAAGGAGSAQYEQAVNLARDLQAQIDQYNAENGLTGEDAIQLCFTGQGQDGDLATAAAMGTGNEAIVFDAAGLAQNVIDSLNLDAGNAGKVTNFDLQSLNGQAGSQGFYPDWAPSAKLAEAIFSLA